jgi:hypothetical protein
MVNKLLVTILLLYSGLPSVLSQERKTVSGTVKSKQTGELIINASIRELGSANGTVTNEYGFFSITVNKLPALLEISAIGKKWDTVEVLENSAKSLTILLTDETVELSEIVVKGGGGNRGRTVAGAQTGVEKLSTREIKNIPVLLGERDVLKTIQLLPGIKSAGDGNSGFFVRGGSTDQNMILLDEAVVYNSSHLLGFFSTFNSDAIKDVTVYKGGMPAQYGGRLSSVLDIKMNEGNNQDYSVSGGLGLISAKLNVEGPIQKDRSSFLVSGRRTYADVFLKASKDSTIKQSKLYFYDLNAKMNVDIGKKDKLFLSGYFGQDKLGFGEQFGIDWGNATGTARWNHIFSPRLFANTSLIFSNYSYAITVKSGSNDFKISSEIRDWNIKQDYQYNLNRKNNIRFGWNSTYHSVKPGEVTASETSSFNSSTLQRRYGLENGIYFSNTWKASNKLTATYGARLTAFSVIGNGNVYDIDSNGKITDSTFYQKGDIVKTYWNLEPRVAIGYQFNTTSSIKMSYVRNVQNMHLLTNSTSNTPTDKWVTSSNTIKPEISDQISLGYYRDFADRKYELTTEVYYKDLKNQIDYRDGADIFANDLVETQLLFGKGRAYGWELQWKKKTGKLTGWVSYTLSKTERKIDGINGGQWYSARQDRTHDLSLVAMYQLNKKWTLSGNFVFYTGDAVTFPNGKYTVGGQTVYYYTNRNGYRMPNYHRLDLGATMQLRKRKNWSSELAFSLYNAYGRENAYTITFRDNETDPSKTEAVQTALFKWVPSISYNFKFK